MKKKNDQIKLNLPDNMSLGEARTIMRTHVMDGRAVECFGCKQNVKIYDRTITVQMAVWLIALVRLHERSRDWVHVTQLARVTKDHKLKTNDGNKSEKEDSPGSGEFAKLRYWGLIVEKPLEDDPTKTASGHWKPTLLGITFVKAQTTVPSHIELYDSKLRRVFEKKGRISIYDCLKKKFNYTDLMHNEL